jgi:uncharacterized protein (TIGR03546 family)
VVFALIMGLTPLNSPHNIFMLFLVLVLRINLPMFMVAWGVFTLFAYAIDPLSHQLGLALLQAPSLEVLWTNLYNSNFWRLMAFNNTLVLGSVALSLLLAAPLFFLVRWLVINYRQHILDWVRKTRLATWLKSFKVFAALNALNNR